MTRARPLARALIIVALAAAMSGCQIIVAVGTHVRADGSGTFTFAMNLDAQAVQVVRAPRSAALFDALEAFFASLRAKGWKVDRAETSQGLSVEATRDFARPSDLAGVLSDIGAEGSGPLRLDMTVRRDRSFLRDSTSLQGSLDATGATLPATLRPLFRAASGQILLAVQADLPGGISSIQGKGTLQGTSAVWQPKTGTVLHFGATSSSVRVSSLLIVLIPLLLLFVTVAVLLIGRRPRARAGPATIGTPLETRPEGSGGFEPQQAQRDARDELNEILEIEPSEGTPEQDR